MRDAMDERILVILKKFGWTEDFRIPIANDRNKTLELEVEKSIQKRIELNSRVKCFQGDSKNLKHYFRSASEQRRYYEKARGVYREQQNAEKCLYERMKNEKTSLMIEKTLIFKSNKELRAVNGQLQAEYGQLTEDTNNENTNIVWSKELEALSLQYIMNGDQHVNALTKYKEQGAVKFETAQVIRLNTAKEAQEYESFLRNELVRIIELECSLEKLTELHRKMRKKSTWLVTQWQSIIEVTKARDNEMRQFQTEFTASNELNAALKNSLMEQKYFLDEQLRNNIRTDMMIHHTQVLMTNRRTSEQKLYKKLMILNSSIVDHGKELFSLKQEVSQKRISLTITKNGITKAKDMRQRLTTNKRQIKEKYFITKSFSTNVQQRIKTLVEIRRNIDEKRKEITHKYRKYDSNLKKLRISTPTIDEQLKSCDRQLRCLKQVKMKLSVAYQRSSKQLYQLSNALLEKNRNEAGIKIRLRYLKGDKANELIVEQTQTLTEISRLYHYKIDILQQTIKEIEIFKREATNLEKLIGNCDQQMNAHSKQKHDLIARIDFDEKSLAALTEQNQRKITAENLIRIRVNNLENSTITNTRNICNLRMTKMEMNAVAQKYDLEVQFTSNLLKIRKRLTKQKISNIKYRIEQINKRILQQMKRCEIITDSLRKDNYDATLNVANYKIQMATERCALMEKGDDLDIKVRKAENEIRAMENTLTLLKISNNACEINSSLQKHNEENLKTYKLMMGEKVHWLAEKKKHETEALKIERETTEYECEVWNELNIKFRRLEAEKEEKISSCRHLQNRIQEQISMINRVRSKIKCAKKLMKTCESNMDFLEREFLSKELLELNKGVLQWITRAISQHDGIDTFIRWCLSGKGILLPSTSRKKMPKISSDYVQTC